MKQIILFLSTMLVSTFGFAASATSSDLGKSSDDVKSLSSAWNKQSTLHAEKNKHDLTIVYGGADVGDKATLASQMSAA